MNEATMMENFTEPTTTALVLTLPQRAQVALGSAAYEITLRELVQNSASIKEIKNPDGRAECHSAYMKLKNSRTGITNASKTAREDATAFSTALIAEERRLIAIVTPEETRLQTLRDAFDTAEAEAKAAKALAEKNRIADIKTRIEAVKNLKFSMIGKSSATLDSIHANLSIAPEYDTFDEFAAEYKLVREDVLFALQSAITAAVAMETETARIAEERAALEIERQEMNAKMAKLEADRAAMLKAEKERQAAADAVIAHDEQVRLAASKAAEEEQLKARVKHDPFSLRSAVIQREQVAYPSVAVMRANAAPSPIIHPAIAAKAAPVRPACEEMVKVIAEHFGTDYDTACLWLITANFQQTVAA
jgi:hypothetical protein